MSPSLPPSALPNQSKLGLKQSLQTTQDKRPYTPYPRAFLFSLDLSYHVPQSYPSSEGFAQAVAVLEGNSEIQGKTDEAVYWEF